MGYTLMTDFQPTPPVSSPALQATFGESSIFLANPAPRDSCVPPAALKNDPQKAQEFVEGCLYGKSLKLRGAQQEWCMSPADPASAKEYLAAISIDARSWASVLGSSENDQKLRADLLSIAKEANTLAKQPEAPHFEVMNALAEKLNGAAMKASSSFSPSLETKTLPSDPTAHTIDRYPGSPAKPNCPQ